MSVVAPVSLDPGPRFLETPRSTLYGVLDLPSRGVGAHTAVLICSPWGWDEVASYRSRKRWAERLAGAGHPVLRFDLPATGNSNGDPLDSDLPAVWLEAIASAAGWLHEASTAPRVAALGLGLGGLLAREACARGAPIEELISWAAPASGAAFVREAKAFSRMQAWNGAIGVDDGALPEGALEAGGFVLSADTIEALKGMQGERPEGSQLERALLLGRDGVAVDKGVQRELEAAGVEVSTGAGAGWGELVLHPEQTQLSTTIASEVEHWLAAATRLPDVNMPMGSVAAERAAEFSVGEPRVRESVWSLAQPWGEIVGVTCEPAGPAAGDTCAVFLNAGAVRSIGPNRLWVEMARQLAAGGIRSLRVDLGGIGESDGDDTALREVSGFYVPAFDAQVDAVIGELEARLGVEQFVLVGLCAGGFWSFRAAQRDRRVRSALLLNAGALTWHADLLADREARKVTRAIDRRWWGKLLRGEIRLERLRVLAAALVAKAMRVVRRRLTDVDPTLIRLETELNRLERGVAVTMAFSEGEPLEAELRAEGITSSLDRWPGVALVDLPGSDHTLRPIAAQRAARALLEREIESHGSRQR